MSDFLGRLAARALGQVPPLGPRLASRFEQAPALSEEVVETAPVERTPEGRALTSPALLSPRERREEERGSEAVVDLDGQAGVQTALSATPPSPIPALSSVSSTALRAAVPERAPEPSALEGRHLNSLGLQPQVSEPRDLLSPEGATPSPRSVPPLSGLGEADRPPSLGLTPQAIQMPPLQGGFLGTVVRTPTEGIDEISSLPALADPRGERIEETGARRPLVPRSALREESALPGLAVPSPRAPFAETGTAPAAEPVIRVTIGRIEVRAAAPAPPPAPAARPAGPRLSLEDYLRRRGEGRM
jgi:hypothetical protein